MGLRQRGQEEEWDGNGEEVKPNQVDDAECKAKDCHKHEHQNLRCRRFLASPQWKCFTLVVVGFTPVFGVILAMPHLLAELHVEPHTWSYWLHYGFGSWISIQFLYNFLATQWRDPGNCKSIKPSQEVTGQFELGGGDDAPRLLYASNWCTKCSNWKPPRSHHCSSCNRCILRMDHHCPFTGNCIGAFNHGHFVLFYIFAFIGLTYSLVLSLMAAYTTDHASRWTELILPKYKEHKDTVGKHFMTGLTGVAVSIILEVLRRKGWEVMIQLAASVLAFIPVLGTGVPAFQMAWFNTTTMERLFPMKEYVQLKAQVYCPLGPGFYRQSGRENLKMILGKRWWIRLLFPVPGQLDMDLFLAPPPSQAGSQALLQRIEQVKENGVKQEVKHCQDLGFDPGPRPEQSV
ncbi:Putative ZDHHC-type palmitoyltransferase 2 (Zinc finger DHHC domain-containing protein 2) [Durusdinium trenchii]|uniref:Palmitoyltransferase n=1 Tax=Durusdinium trenchii TaxID=1381693 RepID=A0ABP0PTT7_9DINO